VEHLAIPTLLGKRLMTTEQEQIAALTAKHEAELAEQIAKLQHQNALRSLCPEGYEPNSFSYANYNEVDILCFEVKNADELRDLITAWHQKYGPFMPIGEYHQNCTTVTAYPWKEYASVGPRHLCDDGIEVSNPVGRGFNSLEFDFYPIIQGYRVRVQVSEAFRAGIPGFHGNISANYNQYGNPIYNSIHKTPPAAFKDSTFTVRFSSGSDDAAHFCGVFSYGRFLGALK